MVTLGEAWITGSLFALIVIIIRCLAKHKLPQFFFYWLWNMTLAMFFIPIRISSLFSAYNFFPGAQTAGKSLLAQLGAGQVVLLNSGKAVTAAGASTELSKFLLVLWITGVAACGLFFVASWMFWKVRLRSLKLSDFKVVQGDKTYKLILSNRIDSPCVFGVFKPKMFFPDSWNFDDHISTELAIKHERIHIKHFDNMRKSALAILFCIQWFNPIVWFVFIFANKDMELYCDSCVVASTQNELRRDYARLLLNHRSSLPLTSPVRLFVNQKEALHERIILIMTNKKTSTTLMIASMLCLVLLFSAFATVAIPLLREQDTGTMTLLAPGETLKNFTGEFVAKKYSGGAVDLHNGDVLLIENSQAGEQTSQLTLSLTPVQGYDDGQIAEYGYVKNGDYISLGEKKLYDGVSLDFAQSDNEVDSYYIKNYCVDTIHINNL